MFKHYISERMPSIMEEQIVLAATFVEFIFKLDFNIHYISNILVKTQFFKFAICTLLIYFNFKYLLHKEFPVMKTLPEIYMIRRKKRISVAI